MRQIANFFHPMSAPRPGIEIGNHAEGGVRRFLQSFPHRAPGHHLRGRAVRIEKEVDSRQKFLLEKVCSSPVYEECPLIFQAGAFPEILAPQIGYLMAALASLNFPPRHVGIYQKIGLRTDQGGADANHEQQAFPPVCRFISRPK